MFNLTLNKIELTYDLPSDPTSFVGRNEANISLTQAGDASPIVLCDGNRTVYPMAKDFSAGIRDPQWLNLAPVTTMTMSLQSLQNVTPGAKSKVCAVVLCVCTCLLLLLFLLFLLLSCVCRCAFSPWLSSARPSCSTCCVVTWKTFEQFSTRLQTKVRQ